jgi:hypothetical protein
MGMQLSGSLNLTGSLNVSGSTIQMGNNTLTGNTILSGSVGISGSTIQSGNNTIVGNNVITGTNQMLGNTTLSGSIIISGSDNTATPTIRIFGDMQTDGVIKFDPVSKTINNSISASYIFVSGSTQDLHFSQNGAGYSNITRLRWLEGNLYTGVLGGGLVSQIDSTNYKISKGSGIIVNLNATTSSQEPYPTIQYVQWNDLSSSINSLSALYDQQFVGIDSNGQIVKQGTPFVNGQFNSLISVGLILHQNNSTINGVKTQPNLSYGLAQRTSVFTRAFGPLKIDGFIISGSGTQGIQVSSGTGYLEGAAYTYDANNPNYIIDGGTTTSKIFRYYNTSSYTDNIYDTNGGTGYTVLDPTQYSNNGTLTTVDGTNANNSQWTIQRVYWFPNSVAKAFIVYYGNAQYTTEALALDGLQEERFIEAPNTVANAIYLGALLLRKDFTWADSTTYRLVPGGLFRSVTSGGGVTGFGILTTDISGINTFTSSIRSEINGIEAYTASLKAAAIVSSSQQITNYYKFAETASANTFYGIQTISGSLRISSSLRTNIITGGLDVNGGVTGSFKGNLAGVADYASLLAVSSVGTTTDTTLYPAFTLSPVIGSYTGLYSHLSGSFFLNGVTRRVHVEGLVVSGSNNIAEISGSFNVSGSTNLTGSVTINESRIDNGWTAYTPQWTAASVNPAIGDGTIEGYYKVIGKTCFVRGNIAMGSTTTFGTGEWYVSMPFTASHADAILMNATLLDNGTAWYNATMVGARAGFNHKAPIQYQNTGGTASDVNPTGPFTWTTSDRFVWNGSYEIA